MITFAEFLDLPDGQQLTYKPTDAELASWQPDIAAMRGPQGPEQPFDPAVDHLDLSTTDWSKARTDMHWFVLFPYFSANNWRYWWAHCPDTSVHSRWVASLLHQAA